MFQTTAALAADERAPLAVEIKDEYVMATSAKITSLQEGLLIEKVSINSDKHKCALFGHSMRNVIPFESPVDNRRAFFNLRYPIPLDYGKVLLVAPLDGREPFIKNSLRMLRQECKIEILEVDVETNYGNWNFRPK